MANSANVPVVRRLYLARGNPEIIRQVLASEVRWEVVDGFPYGAVYKNRDSVLHDFFGRLFADFDEFVATGSEFFESGDHVIALGSYSGRASKERQEVHRTFRTRVDIARRVNRAVAAMCRYRPAGSRLGTLEEKSRPDHPLERTDGPWRRLGAHAWLCPCGPPFTAGLPAI